MTRLNYLTEEKKKREKKSIVQNLTCDNTFFVNQFKDFLSCKSFRIVTEVLLFYSHINLSSNSFCFYQLNV